MSDARYQFVADGAEAVQLATGFQFTEGPQWHPDGYYLFVDIRVNRTFRIVPGQAAEVAREDTGGGNGITFDLQGNVVQCEGANRRMVRVHADGRVEAIADTFEGKRLNAPNDVVCASDGSIYFTDPAIRMAFADRDLPTAVYRIAPDGTLSQFIEAEFPNGLALSLDERTLYINNTRGIPYIQHAEIRPDGTPGRRGILLDMWGEEPGVPDGMKLDADGRIYCTGPGGIWVISPEGQRLAVIPVPEIPSNLAFGGDDLKTLFITARTSVYSVQMKVAGNPHPWFRTR